MTCGRYHDWVEGKCIRCPRVQCNAITKGRKRCTHATVANGTWAEHVEVDRTKCMFHQKRFATVSKEIAKAPEKA
jgi:hypothetical protein